MKNRKFTPGMALFAPALVLLMGNGCSGCRGCQGDKDPDPITPIDQPAPSASVVTLPVEVVDAGEDGDAEVDADASKGTGVSPWAGLRACCAALQSNAASAPPPQSVWMTAAAQYCSATVTSVSNPAQKDAMLTQVRTLLRGSALPSSCK